MMLSIRRTNNVTTRVEGCRVYLPGFEWLECYGTYDPASEWWTVTEPTTGRALRRSGEAGFATLDEAIEEAVALLSDVQMTPQRFERAIVDIMIEDNPL